MQATEVGINHEFQNRSRKHKQCQCRQGILWQSLLYTTMGSQIKRLFSLAHYFFRHRRYSWISKSPRLFEMSSLKFTVHDPFWSHKKLAWAHDLCLIVSKRIFFPTCTYGKKFSYRDNVHAQTKYKVFLSFCLFLFLSFLGKDFCLQFQVLLFLWHISLKEHRDDCVSSQH